jgi:predicted enzyme related to lactoylglutathione lyase
MVEVARVAVDALAGRIAGVFYVADVEDTLDAVTAHGGQVVTPPYPEGTLRVALFADPAGNVLGIWQETSDSRGPR